MKKHLKQTFIQTLKIGFSLALIIWLMKSGRLEFQSLKLLLTPTYIISCILCAGLALAIGTERWRRFLLSQGISISFFQTFQLTLIGSFFNFAMPGGVGGDLVKGYYITMNHPSAKLKAAVTVLMDRMIGLFAMLVLAMTMMLSHWEIVGSQEQLKFIFQTLCFLTFCFLVFWSLTFSRRFHALGLIERVLEKLPKSQPLLRTYEALTNYRHFKKTFALTFFLSLLGQLAGVLFFIIAGRGLGYTEVSPTVYLFVVPVAFMVQAVPISPAGIGVGQTVAYFLFNLTSPGSAGVGPAATTAFQLVQLLFGLFGAYFYLGISKKLKNSKYSNPSTS